MDHKKWDCMHTDTNLVTLMYLTMHSMPETMKQFGMIRSYWKICEIFHPEKSQVTGILEALEQKVDILRTQTRCQIDRDPGPIKVRH